MELSSDTDNDRYDNCNSPSMLTDLQSLEPVCNEFANEPEAIRQNTINCKITDEPFLVRDSTLLTKKCRYHETNEKEMHRSNCNLLTSNNFETRNDSKIVYKVVDDEVTSVICVLYDKNEQNGQCNVIDKGKFITKENREGCFFLKMQESNNNSKLKAYTNKLVYESNDDCELFSTPIENNCIDDAEPTKNDELNCVKNDQFAEMSACEKKQSEPEKDDDIIYQCPGRKRKISVEENEINEKVAKRRGKNCINKAIVIDKYDYATEKVIFNHYSDEYNEDISNELDEEEKNDSSWINVTQSDSFPIHFNFTVQPGLRLSKKEIRKPVDYFKLLFTEEIINMLVDEINRNALRKICKRKSIKSQSWINVNNTSFCTFIAILINMGLNPRKDIESYWTDRKSQFMPYFSLTMSKTYFLNIFSNFCLRNSNNEGSRQSNFQIKKLFDKLTKKFQKYLFPHRVLKIDEVTVNSKGRTCFKINHPIKATNGIMKMFMLSEPDTGYVYGIQPYCENEENQEKYSDLPISSQIALNLIDKLLQVFPGKGYHFYTDHYFSSPELAKELYKRKCHLTGTVCMNKKDMPINLKCNKSDKGMTALRNKELLVLYWYQVKPICLLSNYHTTNILEVSSKLPELKQSRPIIVADYVRNMKGINLEDNFMISSAIVRKTIHRYKCYFLWLLDLCLINAYILYKHHCNKLKEEIKYNHIDFRIEIVEALTTSMVKHEKPDSLHNIVKEEKHISGKLKEQKPCVVCKKPQCWTSCETCGEIMHLEKCFKKYHSQKDNLNSFKSIIALK
ncbi:piggyBac transposable element-derived protein 4-like [Centruroides sculpturatus]|uniref:piggyBac transposable element-derived protein 4-like n=1 Tax=Centruroides sculpturatus TaxID=218467 RepID=UPI000C6DF1A3|nr:piggyBac transposable element-derived protein 4-like [Centruroides sculpturatus]